VKFGAKVPPRQVLDELGIESGDVLFIKASMNFLGYGPGDTLELLDCLVERVGPAGTILMPSFPYPNEKGQPESGAVFDVRSSPSQMGLLTEMFRRWPGAVRSEHFWVPVAAWGSLAAELVAGQAEILNPFGPGSSYRRLVDHGAKMVGLGVSTNYNILAHVADAVLHERYPFRIFTTESIAARIIDRDGHERTMHSVLVTQERRLQMKPSRLVAASGQLRRALRFFDHDGGFVWSLPASLYFEESLRIGRAALDVNRLPPWLEAQS